MYESKIEKRRRELFRKNGGEMYKFVSPGRPKVPDNLCLAPIKNNEHRKIVAQYVRFVEFKAPGKKPDFLQQKEIDWLGNLGYIVEVFDGEKRLNE